MQDRKNVYSVLFLSRRNSARSLMAEAVLGRHGAGRFRPFSAGVTPSPEIDPMALDVLRQRDYPTDGLRPKHWHELTGRDGPVLDFVFTMSDTAAGESLPEWRGRPSTANWLYPDPIKAEGTEWERRRAFALILAGADCALPRWRRTEVALHQTWQPQLPSAGRTFREKQAAKCVGFVRACAHFCVIKPIRINAMNEDTVDHDQADEEILRRARPVRHAIRSPL